jgi:hypothetical protein
MWIGARWLLRRELGGIIMGILVQLLLSIAILFLLAIALGLLGVVGKALYWVRWAWMAHPSDYRPSEDRDEWRSTL